MNTKEPGLPGDIKLYQTVTMQPLRYVFAVGALIPI